MQPLRVYIGYDVNETVAYHVCAHSILKHASVPVSITPLVYNQLPMTRARDPMQSTDFTYSRFLVPWLNDYNGLALFIDCDMLFTSDIKELFDLHQPGMAVSVVQHDYTPKTDRKFLDQVQTKYPRKNWSSVMLFDCSHYHCRRLTPFVVNTESGKYLHRFEWTDRIGSLPAEWNWLVGEYPDQEAKNYHYTLGTPCFKATKDCDKSEIWHYYHQDMNRCVDL